MLKASLKNPVLRRRARQFGRLLRHSAVTPRTGRSYKPRLVSNGELGLTFIGHASFFVQIGGQNVVIDPNFARWLFVLKRLRQPGVQLHDLPPIDLVLVTGARILRDSHRGYGGYVLRDGKHSLYHAGDTAYFSGFHEIGRRLAPELALLPIGAYNPPSFRNVHASPADATRAFLDLNSRWMVPMHYGTFRLSHEPMDEPLQLLDQEARAAGIQDRVLVLSEGVTQIFDKF